MCFWLAGDRQVLEGSRQHHTQEAGCWSPYCSPPARLLVKAVSLRQAKARTPHSPWVLLNSQVTQAFPTQEWQLGTQMRKQKIGGCPLREPVTRVQMSVYSSATRQEAAHPPPIIHALYAHSEDISQIVYKANIPIISILKVRQS